MLAAACAVAAPLAALAPAASAQLDVSTLEPDPRLAPAEQMPLAEASLLTDVARVGDHYFAVGRRGHILRSADTKAWTQVPSPVRSMLTTIEFPSEQVGYIGGHDGVVLKTIDGGSSWALMHFDPVGQRPAIVYDLLFSDADTGWALGTYGLLLRTTDGGKNWDRLEPDFTILGYHNSALTRLNDGALLLVGEKGLAARSTDNGDTWQMIASPYTGSFFGAVPMGNNGAVIYGMRGRLYQVDSVAEVPVLDAMEYDPFSAENVEDPAKQAEMGWTRIPTPGKDSIFSGRATDQGILLVGNAGLILETDRSLSSFKQRPNRNGDALASAIKLDDGRVLAVGRQGIEIH